MLCGTKVALVLIGETSVKRKVSALQHCTNDACMTMCDIIERCYISCISMLSLCATGGGSDLYIIQIFAFGVGLAAFIRSVIILFRFIKHCRQRRTLQSFFSELQNWIEVPMLLLSFIFISVYSSSCLCPAGWQWQVGTIAVLLVWVDLLEFIRSLQLFDIGKITVV